MENNSKKILIVDDELSFRDPISDTLEDKGFSPLTASSGREALALIKKDLPALVITDIRMPEMDGITLFKEIKKEHPDLPVIMMSAYGSIESAVHAMKDGAADYIAKPLNLEEMHVRVQTIFENLEIKKKLQKIELYATTASNIKTLGRVGANNAHKFNNLLTMPATNRTLWLNLIDALQAIQKNPDDEKAKKVIAYFTKEGEMILNDERKVLNKMQEILKMWWTLSADSPDEKPYPLSLKDCITTALTLVEHELYAGNTILADLTDNLPSVLGSYNDLTRLHINLLLNAVDANSKIRQKQPTFQGAISAKVSCDGKKVISEITDNGIGVDTETKNMITEQLSSSKRIFSISQGGLYDCYGIINKYAGTITCESDGIGSGTTFIIRIPFIKA